MVCVIVSIVFFRSLGKEDLFSTPVWNWQSNDKMLLEIKKLESVLDDLEANHEKAKPKTVQNGWRINDPHNIKEFSLVRTHLLNMCKKCLIEDQRLDVSGRPLILQSWLNVHRNTGFNTMHHHGNALLSGVFYLEVPEGSGALEIVDPRPGVYFAPNFGFKALGGDHLSYKLTPKPGLAILFPGYLQHFVNPALFKEEGKRRSSIAFNMDIGENT